MLLFPEAWMNNLFYGIELTLTALLLVCLWFVFEKMNKPGWKGIIPGYNLWVMIKTMKKPKRWFWIPLATVVVFFIAFVFFISAMVLAAETDMTEFLVLMDRMSVMMLLLLLVLFVYTYLLYSGLAKCFGRGIGFSIGLFLLPFVFFPILAFGDDLFTEPEDRKPNPQPIVTSGAAEDDSLVESAEITMEEIRSEDPENKADTL